jgi:hypothetical protein
VDIIKRLFSPFTQGGTFYLFSVKCKRCGETIQGRINVYNEPGMMIDEKGRACYSCRKVLMGDGHCFQQIEVTMKFDEGRRLIERKITGGEFVGK